jgi:hypothetical protein
MAAENHSVQLACNVLGVSEAGYYAWRSRSLDWMSPSKAFADAVALTARGHSTIGAPIPQLRVKCPRLQVGAGSFGSRF